MKNKNVKINKKVKRNKINKDKIDKILIVVLLVCLVLSIILSLILYFNGIKKILPIILVFVLGITSALMIYLLSKDTMTMKKNRDKSVAKKLNV